MMDINQLILALANGQFHSGQTLGQRFGVTRAAIWKAIRSLNELGLQIDAVSGKGYRLRTPLELYEAEKILHALPLQSRRLLSKLEIHSRLDSTNTYLLSRLDEGLTPGHVCLAEYQSAGKGRRGRRWVSPYGRNIYLSVYWQYDSGPAFVSSLSLAVAIAVRAALTELGVDDVGLKWPNDLYRGGRKLAGILLEVSGEVDGPSDVVVGVGLNYDMPTSHKNDITQSWADLKGVYPHLSRNILTAQVLGHLLQAMHNYQQSGFDAFYRQWFDADIYLNRAVTIQMGNRVIHGVARGVDEAGMLLLETGGELHRITSGEVSLREIMA